MTDAPVRPQIRYAKSGDVNIAFEVSGAGPLDLVFVPGWWSHLEIARESAEASSFWDRLASFCRLVRFDKRGTGMSDRVQGATTLEQRMDDVRAVMDAAGSERAALFGVSEGGPMSILFAATHPQRTQALILYGSYPRRVAAPDYPWAPSAEWWHRYCEQIEEHWGTDAFDVELRMPSKANDPIVRERYVDRRRRAMSPGAARALCELNGQIDVRDVLPSVRVPTLILHVIGDRMTSLDGSRYMASRIPGARLVELPGTDHNFGPDVAEMILAEVQHFLTGVRPAPDHDRVLATVLFTDLVGSTRRAADVGDHRWRDLLAEYHAIVRRELERFQGHEIDNAGDGFLASFDGPARAIRCAAGIRRGVRELSIEARAGLHTGECERLGAKLSGIGVHIGARVAATAGAGEILVSRTVKDLVAGSGIRFIDRGTHILKDVPGEWTLFAVDDEP